MKKIDLMILGTVLFLALFFLVLSHQPSQSKHNGKIVKISVNGKMYKTIPLKGENEEIIIENGWQKNVLKINNEGAVMTHANCFDKICMNTGVISKIGEMIICLPNRVVVEVIEDN